jgi:hypothetical protein
MKASTGTQSHMKILGFVYKILEFLIFLFINAVSFLIAKAVSRSMSQWTKYISIPLHVGFVVDKVALKNAII